MSLVSLINFKSLGDERGDLIALEGNSEIPFDIKRVYYIFGTEAGVARGFHAHKELVQVAVCISGSCRVLMDNGQEKMSVLLDAPKTGLLINVMQWHEMYDFSSDCVLLVLASDKYNESDYIRNYEHFISQVEIK